MRENRCERFGEILKTTNYDLFHKLLGNRHINEAHVARLMVSFKQKQLIVPIIVNQDMMVIDGQHRLEAARRLGFPVYYIGIEDYGLNECHILNANNKVYKPEDFLAGYASLGYKEYKALQEFREEYPFLSISIATTYLNGGTRTKVTDAAFKNGMFAIKDYATACLWAERTFDFKEYAGNFFTNRNFNNALIKFYKHPRYNHQRMLQKLSYNSGALKHQAKEKFFIENLCEIYNLRSKEEDKIYSYEITHGHK